MRVKILIFPAVLAISITIFIAYIWPEQVALRQNKSSLEQSRSLLNEIQAKKKNIESLKSDLNQNKDKETFIQGYLPLKRSDEDILNGMDYLAVNSGVSIAGLAIEKAPAPVIAPPAPAEVASKEILFPTGTASDGTIVTPIVEPQMGVTRIKANVIGSFENIKTFLEQVYKMEMYNDISNLSIAAQAKGEGEQASTGTLSVSVSIEFGYLSQMQINGNYSAPIFSQSSLDFATYNKLSGLISKKIPTLEVSGQGRINPFLP
jgi:Tfp pilus assembly protein PilO